MALGGDYFGGVGIPLFGVFLLLLVALEFGIHLLQLRLQLSLLDVVDPATLFVITSQFLDPLQPLVQGLLAHIQVAGHILGVAQQLFRTHIVEFFGRFEFDIARSQFAEFFDLIQQLIARRAHGAFDLFDLPSQSLYGIIFCPDLPAQLGVLLGQVIVDE